MQSMHTYRAWTNKEGHALGRTQQFREVKTDELTRERLRDVAETYKRATASDTRAMMVNSNNIFGKRSQGTCVRRLQEKQGKEQWQPEIWKPA